VDLSFQILGILLHLDLGGWSFQVSFSKRAVQMFVKNIGWLKIGKYWLTKDWSWGFTNPLHSPRNEHRKTEFGKTNSEKKFGESETFSRSKFDPATGESLQNRACRFGLKFPPRKIHSAPGVKAECTCGNGWSQDFFRQKTRALFAKNKGLFPQHKRALSER